MPTQEESAKSEARAALYKTITATAEELESFPAPTAAEALKHLAEAFAFVSYPNQPH